ncbi:MAG TPA: alpha/beta fold hydrolase [Streptosporangiaceae bacterium]|jgi:ABC-2 type transport system ATP-binding protein
MSLRSRRWRRAPGLLAAVALVGGTVFAGGPARAAAPSVRMSEQRVTVTDGPKGDQRIALDTSYFTPSGGGRHPAVLLGHGFGGSKADVAGEARSLAGAGYAVLTWSARGFGASEGQIGLDSPDYEVKDVQGLVSWLAKRPEVRLDGPGDPRVGVAGASYGGGIALMSAAFDHRIDAIAPQITWNDLAGSLFPNAVEGSSPSQGVFKKMWAGLLFTSGTAGFGGAGGGALPGVAGLASETERMATGSCGRFRPEVCAMYDDVARTGKPTASAVKLLRASSPGSYAGRVRVPTLLIQGQSDSLFPLDQANANAKMIARTGAPVAVVWGDGGHDAGGTAVADAQGLTRRWFDRFLKPATPPKTATGPGFSVTRSGGVNSTRGEVVTTTADAARYPGLDGTATRTVPLDGPAQAIANPPGGSPASISALPGLGSLIGGGSGGGGSGRIGSVAGIGGLSVDMPGQAAVFESAPLAAPLRVTGSPTVRLRVSGADDIVAFAKLYDVGAGGRPALPHQLAAPIRVTGAAKGRTVTVRLPAIDYEFARGDRLRLAVSSTDMAYATPAAGATYTIATSGPGIGLPTDTALRARPAGMPAWVWILPCAAVAAALVITFARRRRRRSGSAYDPELAEVPLVITGLTKGYSGDRLAVDHLSLRAGAGQVVGLLGPNGAGKTTALRMLMGLLFPDDGEIRIFGHRVTPGAPVLSRLGSFVEGPGFLPHLSGRANLELYWRATGRPAADAHLEEALEIAGLGDAVRRPVRTYSQGMRQRLAIAQAMLGLPDLLVLDEPTNGLDPPQIAEMRTVLNRYARDGRTVIVSSHLLAEVEQTCSHVVVMRAGVGVAAGTVAEIVGQGATLVLGTPSPDQAREVLGRTPGVVDVRANGAGLVVRLDGATSSEVLAELVAAGVPVDSAVPNRRLEDVFLALIEDGSPGGGA